MFAALLNRKPVIQEAVWIGFSMVKSHMSESCIRRNLSLQYPPRSGLQTRFLRIGYPKALDASVKKGEYSLPLASKRQHAVGMDVPELQTWNLIVDNFN